MICVGHRKINHTFAKGLNEMRLSVSRAKTFLTESIP